MEVSREDAKIIIEFMRRTELKGSEVGAYAKVYNLLESIVNEQTVNDDTHPPDDPD